MKKRKLSFWLLLIVLLGFFATSSVYGADWPMWRCDAKRSGYSPAELPKNLKVRWVIDLPKIMSAWPGEPRNTYDWSYEPIVMGKSLFVGSPNDGSVTAYETGTGKQKWKFYSEGPVRFAPVAEKGKIYFGSDDGRVYCLDAETGGVKWTFRAAPESRPDLRHFGNNRLISAWPVRGGIVLSKGKLYFASGLWPTMGVFVYCLNAETGKAVWTNDKLNLISNVIFDHNAYAESGISPQGHLALSGDTLVIPNGRSLPAGVSAKTGKLLFYVQGMRNGNSRVVIGGKYGFVGGAGVIDLVTGRELGSRRFMPESNKGNSNWNRRFLGEAPKLPYKFVTGCSAWSVFGPGVAYGSSKGAFYAYNLNAPKMDSYEYVGRGEKMRPNKWMLPELWKYESRYAKKEWPSKVFVRAGRRLYGYVKLRLMALEIPRKGAKPKVVWQERINSTPTSMLAGDGKLFVVTDKGKILCYGSKPPTIKRHDPATARLPDIKDEWAQKAGKLLEKTQTAKGYCIVLGINNGRLIEEILKQSKLKVIGVDGNADTVKDLRNRLVKANLYGRRAEIFVSDPLKFELPPYIATLVVSERLSGSEIAGKTIAKKFLNLLRPYTGVSCFELPVAEQVSFEKWVGSASQPELKISRAGNQVVLHRAGPLKGSAAWTHETADPARSYYSRDKLVKLPLAVLWYGEGSDHGFHKANDYGSGVKPQVAGGRLFAYQIREKKLYALDAYTGMLLWKADVENFTRYASMEDGVYVAGGNVCVVYNPATGKVLKRFKYTSPNAKNKKLHVADIRVTDNTIVIGAAFSKSRNIVHGLWDSNLLIALDRKTGKQLWTKAAAERISGPSLSVGDGLVFCSDSLSVAKTSEMQRRGNPPKTLPAEFIALDERTGKVKWSKKTQNPFMTFNHFMAMRSYDDWTAYSKETKILLAGKHKNIYAFEAATGQLLWQKRKAYAQPIILSGNKFLPQKSFAVSIRTGRKADNLTYRIPGYSCNYGVGGVHLFLVRAWSVGIMDNKTGKKHYLRNTRSGCSNSIVAADGLLTVANFMDHCKCNYPLQTSFSMYHLPAAKGWDGIKGVTEPFGKK